MSTRQDPTDEMFSAYVLDIIDSDGRVAFEEHTADCQECRMKLAAVREMEAALGEVPPEAFLEGPPEDGDLLLQSTLRQIRAEKASSWRRKSIAVSLGVAASAVAVFFGGFTVGGSGARQSVAGPSTTSAPAGVRLASATDASTHASMQVQLTPFKDYVKLNAAVTGVPSGERCRLVVVSTDGDRQTALSWVVPTNGGASTLPPIGQGGLEGAAAVDPHQVKEVVVENEQGIKLVQAVPS